MAAHSGGARSLARIVVEAAGVPPGGGHRQGPRARDRAADVPGATPRRSATTGVVAVGGPVPRARGGAGPAGGRGVRLAPPTATGPRRPPASSAPRVPRRGHRRRGGRGVLHGGQERRRDRRRASWTASARWRAELPQREGRALHPGVAELGELIVALGGGPRRRAAWPAWATRWSRASAGATACTASWSARAPSPQAALEELAAEGDDRRGRRVHARGGRLAADIGLHLPFFAQVPDPVRRRARPERAGLPERMTG